MVKSSSMTRKNEDIGPVSPRLLCKTIILCPFCFPSFPEKGTEKDTKPAYHYSTVIGVH